MAPNQGNLKLKIEAALALHMLARLPLTMSLLFDQLDQCMAHTNYRQACLGKS